MVLNKTSNKFLQWSDTRANMVYGLGFPIESDLGLFMEKFHEIRSIADQQPTGGGGGSEGVGSDTSLPKANVKQPNDAPLNAPVGSTANRRSPPPPSTSSASSHTATGGPAAVTGGGPIGSDSPRIASASSQHHHRSGGGKSKASPTPNATGASPMPNHSVAGDATAAAEQMRVENEKLMRALHQRLVLSG